MSVISRNMTMKNKDKGQEMESWCENCDLNCNGDICEHCGHDHNPPCKSDELDDYIPEWRGTGKRKKSKQK